MAATTPSNSNPSGDESHIFRRSVAKPKAPPEEPTELLEFDDLPVVDNDDEEDALGGLPAAGDSPSMIRRRGYREGSSVNLGGSGNLPGESGSSIFANSSALTPSLAGSGWFDSIPPQPRPETSPSDDDLGQSHVVEDLFADLDDDSSSAPVANWQKQPATDSISESDVIRAFDNLSSRDVTKNLAQAGDGLDYDSTQPSGSHIFPHSSESDLDLGDGDLADPSGVDLLNADWNSERITGPRSSIFGAPSNRDPDRTEVDELSLPASDNALDGRFMAGDGGSSIFDKTTPILSFHEQEDAVDFPEPELGEDDQASGRVDWESKPLPGDLQPSLMVPFGGDDDADVDPFSDEMPTLHTPVPVPKGLIGTSGAGMVVAPVRAVVDYEDDEPIPAPKAKREPVRVKPPKGPKEPARRGGGGLVGWVGGGLLGLLIGAGAFAGLYVGGVLPNSDETKPVAQLPPGPSPEMTALTAQQEVLKLELATAKAAAAKADGDKATLASELENNNATIKTVVKELETANASLTTAKAKAAVDLKAALADKDTAEDKLKTARADVTKAEDDAEKAKLDSTKATADLKVEQLKLKTAMTEFDVAKAKYDLRELESKAELGKATKLTENLTAMVVEAQKKMTASEAGLGSIVKDLKANKLIDDKLDTPAALAQLPDVFKKLGSLSMSPDAKKAAEALLAAKKDLDAAQAALKLAENAKAKAETNAVAAKLEAETKVAAAAKKAEADVLVAKKETDAAKKETETKVSAAVEKATADAKKSLADAEAEKLALTQKQKAEVAVLQASFTQQLAEARQGGVQITPAEVLALDRADRDYNAGVSAYQSKNFAKALTSLDAAVKLQPADARYWYYLGLTRYELGQRTEAEASFKKGYDLESRNKPNAALVGEALERIQGNARKELSRFR